MISIWLLFTPQSEEVLRREINRLSRQYSGPIFRPHITLFGSLDVNLEILTNIADQCFAGVEIFQVQTGSAGQTSDIWKTVFLEVKLNDKLQALNTYVDRKLGPYHSYIFKPHISLIYKKIATAERRLIAGKIRSDSLYEIGAAALVDTGASVPRWSILKQCCFRTPSTVDWSGKTSNQF